MVFEYIYNIPQLYRNGNNVKIVEKSLNDKRII